LNQCGLPQQFMTQGIVFGLQAFQGRQMATDFPFGPEGNPGQFLERKGPDPQDLVNLFQSVIMMVEKNARQSEQAINPAPQPEGGGWSRKQIVGAGF